MTDSIRPAKIAIRYLVNTEFYRNTVSLVASQGDVAFVESS